MENNKKTDKQPNYPMYNEVVAQFSKYMIKELAANHMKGNRDGKGGWLEMSDKQLLNELYYHVGKLQMALMTGNKELVKEFTADVANGAMMVFDNYWPLAEIPFDK